MKLHGKEDFVTYTYSGAVPSEIASICGLVREQVEEMRRRCALDGDQLMDLRLILSELMINGCEHGNQNDHCKCVHLRLRVTENQIQIAVRDEGEGFVPNLEPTDERHHIDCGGRGLRIVSQLVDQMDVQKNEVRCTLYRVH